MYETNRNRARTRIRDGSGERRESITAKEMIQSARRQQATPLQWFQRELLLQIGEASLEQFFGPARKQEQSAEIFAIPRAGC